MDLPPGLADDRLKLLAVGLFAAALISLFLPTLVSIVFIGTVLLVTLLYLNENSGWSLAHPFAFLFLTLLTEVVGPLFDYLVLDAQETEWALLGQPRTILVKGSFVVLVGVAALIFGYALSIGQNGARRLPTVKPSWNRYRAIRMIQIYAVLGLLALGYVILSVGLTDISAKREFATVYIGWIVQFLFFASLLGLVTLLHHDEPLLSVLGIGSGALMGAYFFYGFLVSSRSAILWGSLLLLAIYVQYRGIQFVKLVSLGAVFTILSGLMIALRGDADSVFDFLVPSAAMHTLFGADRGGITAISHLVVQVPHELPLQFGRTFIYWVVFPIPRAVWPGKPVILSRLVAIQVYDAGNGTPPGLIGDLYWNFWLIGVIVGMGIVGILLRAIVQYRLRARQAPTVILLMTVAIFLVARLPSVAKLVINIGLWGVPLVSAILFIQQVGRQRPAEALADLPDLYRTSVTIRLCVALLSVRSAVHRVLAGSHIPQVQRAVKAKVKQISESSLIVALTHRFDQYPENE